REGLDALAAMIAELGETDQLLRAASRLARRDAEVAGIDEQVLLDAQVGIEAVLLRDHADLRLDPPRRGGTARQSQHPHPAPAPAPRRPAAPRTGWPPGGSSPPRRRGDRAGRRPPPPRRGMSGRRQPAACRSASRARASRRRVRTREQSRMAATPRNSGLARR